MNTGIEPRFCGAVFRKEGAVNDRDDSCDLATVEIRPRLDCFCGIRWIAIAGGEKEDLFRCGVDLAVDYCGIA
jgi:hypothetical protein